MIADTVESLAVRFDSTELDEGVEAEMVKLVESHTISLLDAVFVAKADTGTISESRPEALAALAELAPVDGHATGLIESDCIARAAETLTPGTSVILLVWEDLWAAPVSTAIGSVRGVTSYQLP